MEGSELSLFIVEPIKSDWKKMIAATGENFWFAYGLLPAMIFFTRICDVSLDTVRIILINRGYKLFAAAVGFAEVLIWLLAISQVMKNLHHPVCYLAYAGGFAAGNYVGIVLANRISLGKVLFRVVTQIPAIELVNVMRSERYGVTTIAAQGNDGPVNVLFSIVPRRDVNKVTQEICRYNPNAFYTIEEINFVQNGIFPAPRNGFRVKANPEMK